MPSEVSTDPMPTPDGILRLLVRGRDRLRTLVETEAPPVVFEKECLLLAAHYFELTMFALTDGEKVQLCELIGLTDADEKFRRTRGLFMAVAKRHHVG